VRGNYDYIFIDCLPSLSLLTVNAMATATEVFVPLQAHPFALEGLGKLFEVVGMIREAMNPSLKVSGVLVTMFDSRTNVSKVTMEQLRGDDRLREHIFTTTIKQNIKVAESQKEGIPVTVFDPSCHAAKAYQALCDEVLEMENGVLASLCAARITSRQKAAGEKITFTSDLVAPAGKPQEVPPAGKQNEAPPISAAPSVHVAPVTALVGKAPEVQQASSPPEIPPAAQTSDPPAEKPAKVGMPSESSCFSNSPDAESIHASGGVAVEMAPGLDAVAAAQAAQSGISLTAREAPVGVGADISDENYRPRLQIKPGSLNIPLPGNSSSL
jgi:chromosome partitioning protein